MTDTEQAARMKRLGITQEFLAEYVGLSQSEVSKVVSGVRAPGKSHRKIANALQELEAVAVFFAPMKPAFEDADAVKEWLHSPALPNLFKLLTSVPRSQQKKDDLQQVHSQWLEFLQSEKP